MVVQGRNRKVVNSKLSYMAKKLSPGLARRFPGYFSKHIQNPIFVIGSAKSGKSLFARLLRLHPDIAYWQEANEIWDPYGYPWDTSGRETLPHWADPVAYTERWWRDVQPLCEQISATFGAYQWLLHKPYLLNDTPLNTFRIPFLLEMFPNARFIHVVRDGREFVCWRVKKQYEKINSNPAYFHEVGLALSYEELLVRLAILWREIMEEVIRQDETLQLSLKGKLMELKYEKLCADTVDVMTRTCQFVGLNPSRFILTIQENKLKVLEPRWKKMLDPKQVSHVTAAMAPMLAQKGYV